ncbi:MULTISPECIES: hypothetical protein [unclassified Pseudomonas]|uniref:hypothetical protein n=1 Tax=unclassified Pseudomonas TaxID=196821 RepID=UPI0011A12CFB|nr:MULTISPECIES: hypothetical protein [unclassified Pseudomonas]TWC22889.1 hypothetical protein FBY00_101117 [Pseudomonas sp. SJZ075]TWC38231.1 hypothetical protein FBY02_101258 [Pseudomonas sp. SJZ078]TWC58821.1 hypothetical protein FBY11_101258 [Pseudomonas sp. SJZ124]TWC94314.1 hypothetical protein FBY09_101177 [Pseudomonas sp. SJZ101]
MTLCLDPTDIVFQSFDHTEVPQPEWDTDIPHWRSYAQHLFQANGETLNPQHDQVQAWVTSPERASFSDMITALLPRLAAVIEPGRVKTVLMAHWTPDLHMGSSVVNAAIHQLGLSACLALAISDRGPDAGLFALDGLNDCLAGKDEDGLLLIAEQKNLMYFSPLMAALQPENNACVCLLNKQQRGLRYQGFRRTPVDQWSSESLLRAIEQLGLVKERLVLIGPARLLEIAPVGTQSFAVNPRLLCAAPFVALRALWQPQCDYLLISENDNGISLCGLAAEEGPR